MRSTLNQSSRPAPPTNSQIRAERIATSAATIERQVGDLDQQTRGLAATAKGIKIPPAARENGERFRRDLLAYTTRLEGFCLRTRGSL